MERKKLMLLDMCCKAGGTSMGYSRAGFDVTGIDIDPQPDYPFPFILGDALTFDFSTFDVIHASPPCQAYSPATSFHKGARQKHTLQIADFRQILQKSGKPYIIENVERARKHMIKPILLCAQPFGLRTYRHRLFESNLHLSCPPHTKHMVPVAPPGAIPKNGEYWSVGGHFGHKDRAQKEALGIDWMIKREDIANAIPPVYTQYIGVQIIRLMK